MNREEEFKREISQHVSNAALALIPILGIIAGFAVVHRDVENLFIPLAIIAAITLVCSLIFGGVGLSRLRRNITEGISFFNLQAVSCVIGFILILLTFTQIGEPQVDKTNEKLSNISATIDSLRLELREIRSEVKHQDSLLNHSIPEKK